MTTTAVGLTRDLPSRRVMRTQVGGQDLVVWRATNGAIAAWNNRCPHRGMALSHGFVRGDTLACLYHGWHYGSSGVCTYIPAHPELTPPDTIRTQVFSVAERDGVIWVNIQGQATPGPLPFAAVALRSFEVATSADAFERACQATPFDGALPASLGAGVYHLGTRRIVVLHNPQGADRTHITALVDNAATALECAAVSRWCEAARRNACTAQVAA